MWIDPLRPGAGGFAADVDEVGAVRCKFFSLPDGRLNRGKPATIAEAIGRNVQNPHHQGPAIGLGQPEIEFIDCHVKDGPAFANPTYYRSRYHFLETMSMRDFLCELKLPAVVISVVTIVWCTAVRSSEEEQNVYYQAEAPVARMKQEVAQKEGMAHPDETVRLELNP